MKKTLIILAVFIGVLVCAVGYSDSQYRTALGHTPPKLWLSDNGGVTLDDLRGKYVLLNFWKSTDAPSRRSTNDYTAWLRRHPSKNIEYISVNLDDSRQMFREIARIDSLIPSTQYYVGGDTAKVLATNYGLDKGLGTMLINPEGKIFAHNPSWDELNEIAR